MPQIDRAAFVSQHQAQKLDLGRLAADPKAQGALQAAGVSLDQVEKAAGADKVLTAEEAVTLIESLGQAGQSAAAEALGRLLADPGLQPVDRPGSVFGALLASTAASRDLPLSRERGPGAEGAGLYVSAKTLEARSSKKGGPDPYGHLGSYGVLGAYSALGELGPIGDNVWNPSRTIDSSYSALADLGSSWDGRLDGGPLTEKGPLGEDGPVGEAYFDSALFEKGTLTYNAFADQLRGLGEQAVLGPHGVLGAKGALGPLGPVGAHGFGTDENGSYVDSEGAVQRTLDVFYDDDQTVTKTHELYEKYTEGYAKQMVDNDTSFMVEGRIAYEGRGQYETDEFEFTSNSDQLVSVAVVPEKQLDDFDFEIVDDKGKVLVDASADELIDWAVLQVKEGTRLKVRVKLKDSDHWLGKTYRLYVTGSGEDLKAPFHKDGDHVKELGT